MAKKKRRKKQRDSKFVLPTEKTAPSMRIGDYSMLIHGLPKVGKTSVAAQFPETLFLCFEPGTKGLDTYEIHVESWADFVGWAKALAADRSKYKTIVIDTVDIAHKLCREFICRKLGVTHPSQAGWGEGWDGLSTEFQKWMAKIQKLGRGVIFISHSQEKEITALGGDTYNRIVPTLSNSAAKIMVGMSDFIFYFYMGKKERRWIRVDGTAEIEAGTRGETGLHFKDLKVIPMGENAHEAYVNLLKGFKNELKPRKKPAEKPKKKRKKKEL